ncbi:MAG: glycine dehydrogenase (aminomethyl-transferring) [Flavobacteriales bacterium]|nr:glycine dehydrogenase (aminomethyl-transferring) [Flavobacteriales bacterium]
MLFTQRHIGTSDSEKLSMLKELGYSSMDELIEKTIPGKIRLTNGLEFSKTITESKWLADIKRIAHRNKVFKTYIGLGYHDTETPSVILRNIFENPGWYTAYTPYQAEIAQGRLEALLNFQTMVTDLTGLPVANASLLDESTAAAEAMIMLFNSRKRAVVKEGVCKFFVDDGVFPQTLAVLKNRATPLGIDLVVGSLIEEKIDGSYFGAFAQYPNLKGEIKDYQKVAEQLHANNGFLVIATDILGLTLIKEPGKFGADVVVGTTQRFGVPVGFGGPHAAFFATREAFKRNIPGRIIGVSKDAQDNPALRMALQTREQHIKREKATSNICTAQALLAVMASMYAVYHGPKGIQKIATHIAKRAKSLKTGLEKQGYEVISKNFFDTLAIKIDDKETLKKKAEQAGVNFYYGIDNLVLISLNETTKNTHVKSILEVFGENNFEISDATGIEAEFKRTTTFLQHPVFNKYHSETEMMRYLKRLENKDLSLVHSMIALGSCTMKLNAASEMIPLSWREFNSIHPFVPVNQTEGYLTVINDLKEALKTATGFADVTLQPNSGAQGEYAGLMVIRAYHEDNGEPNRNICLIPSSAHGTNPASAIMAGFKVVVVNCDEDGNIDLNDLKNKAEENKENLGALMVTYPSTHGVFEEAIIEITDLIHELGGQVYMDGANMNAQVGLTNPATIGADVCHLNLHKTFAIPHGGGGPGLGPIGVAQHLVPFLPSHPVVKTGGFKGIDALAAAPYSSALIAIISLGYCRMLGAEGMKSATESAILNANYLKSKLENYYPILYTGKNNTVAHEMIVDCRGFKDVGITVTDIAKRLIDFGFHAPTVSFPVVGTMMIEPTESESKEELDRFAEAMITIADEIKEIENGIYPKDNNPLVNAPHTAQSLIASEWNHSYSREKAAYPTKFAMANKYWVPVSRIDDAYGDRNLICSCPPMEEYA